MPGRLFAQHLVELARKVKAREEKKAKKDRKGDGKKHKKRRRDSGSDSDSEPGHDVKKVKGERSLNAPDSEEEGEI